MSISRASRGLGKASGVGRDGLYLRIMPKRGRYWLYCYRFQGRENLLSLGCNPNVASASARHHVARQMPALGVDPPGRSKALRLTSAKKT
ncbi:MAG: Arm DNA-binding domain-containing protein [Steroidobacteraceae bacterium]